MKLTYVHHIGSDLTVVNAARVSFKKESFNFGTSDVRLINYLAKHKHHSPFNHSFLTCHVKAPIFVARQLVKHKFMPWNEVSRRYVDDEPEFYWPKEWRGRAKDKKQGSEENIFVDLGYGLENQSEWSKAVDEGVLSLYEFLLYSKVAPEQARMVLPLNTYTEWYWSGTLGAWLDMYKLRSKEDTQWETRQVALQAGEIIQAYWPYSFEAYLKQD